MDSKISSLDAQISSGAGLNSTEKGGYGNGTGKGKGKGSKYGGYGSWDYNYVSPYYKGSIKWCFNYHEKKKCAQGCTFIHPRKNEMTQRQFDDLKASKVSSIAARFQKIKFESWL